jgi:hypothetical protein
MSKVKIAKDSNQAHLQFSHLNCGSAIKVVGAAVGVSFASEDSHVVVTPLSADAYVTVTATSTAAPTSAGTGFSLGKFIPFPTSYTMTIRSGEYIASSADLNVVALGEI